MPCTRSLARPLNSRGGLARNFRSNISFAFSRCRLAIGTEDNDRPQFLAGVGLLFVLFCPGPGPGPGRRLIGLPWSLFEIIPTFPGTVTAARESHVWSVAISKLAFLGVRVAVCSCSFSLAKRWSEERDGKTNPILHCLL